VAFVTEWFQRLRDDYGLHPTWIHLDKDASEIGAATNMWPHAKLSLCLWHVDQAVKRRCGDNKTLPKMTGDAVEELLKEFPIETAGNTFTPKVVETPEGPKPRHEVKKDVCTLMRCHYKLHPLVWSGDGESLQAKAIAIRNKCVAEMYQFCCARKLGYLWVYLFRNW